jgi:hypothetical protein
MSTGSPRKPQAVARPLATWLHRNHIHNPTMPKLVNEPRNHHYAPQFFLRNFAVDEAKTRVTTVAKHGDMAIWAERSIENIGYERDFYVHTRNGAPISVETAINRRLETPLSRSDTWAKISSGRTDALDQRDRPILYSLIRHLEVRTPHFEATTLDLSRKATSVESEIPFSDEERLYYSMMRSSPNLAKATLNHLSMTTEWAEESFHGALIMVVRSPVPLRSSTTPVFALPCPPHSAIGLPLPGMSPYQLALTLNPTTLVSLVPGDFDGAFSNHLIDYSTASGFNRQFAGQFAHFDAVRHLISSRTNLVDDMIWASYDLLDETPKKITFRRRVA